MRRKTICILTAAFIGAALNIAAAQVPEAEIAENVPRQYTVELIVFEYADSSYDGNEIFVPEVVDVAEPDEIDEEGPVFSDIPAMPGDVQDLSKLSVEEIPAVRQLDLRLLEPEQFTMGDIYSKLEKLDAYRPILHAGWTQSVAERDVTPPVRLRILGNVPLRLDGDFTLYLSRYLHLVVNLQLDAVSLQPVQSYAPGATSLFDKPDLRPTAVQYHINEDRIFKSGDLRYFDHPKFGVVVRITRFEATGTGESALSAY